MQEKMGGLQARLRAACLWTGVEAAWDRQTRRYFSSIRTSPSVYPWSLARAICRR